MCTIRILAEKGGIQVSRWVGEVWDKKGSYEFINRSRAHGIDEVDSELEDEYCEE